MSRDQDTYRLTFNNAAGAHFIPEGTKGFLIELKNDQLVFEPVRQSSGFRVAPLIFRPRGGVEMTIGGERGDDLINFLTRSGTLAKPYFKVSKLPASRFTVSHYDKNRAPPKGWPHMRLWFPRDASDSTAHTALAMFTVNDRMNYFRSMMIGARQALDQAADERKIGRPSKAVLAAREAMAQFVALAELVIPSFKNEAHQEAVAEALAILNRISKTTAKINREIANDTQESETFPQKSSRGSGHTAPEGMGGQLTVVPSKPSTAIRNVETAADSPAKPVKAPARPVAATQQPPPKDTTDQHLSPQDKDELSYIRDAEMIDDGVQETPRAHKKTHWDRSRLRGSSSTRRRA